MKMITAELTGKPLDWALAVALQYAPQAQYGHVFVPAISRGWPIAGVVPFDHTDPATCMGLIKEYCIQLFPFCDGEIVRWDADIRPDIRIVIVTRQNKPSPATSCRCGLGIVWMCRMSCVGVSHEITSNDF